MVASPSSSSNSGVSMALSAMSHGRTNLSRGTSSKAESRRASNGPALRSTSTMRSMRAVLAVSSRLRSAAISLSRSSGSPPRGLDAYHRPSWLSRSRDLRTSEETRRSFTRFA